MIPRALGLAFVALSTVAPLTALHAGAKLLKIFDDMKVNLPWPAWLVVQGHDGLYVLVLMIPVVALVLQRHERAAAFMGVLGILQLLIAAEYGFAVWFSARLLLH